MELAGKVAIVTGGAVRLGRDISRSLAVAGMKVCLHYGHSQAEAVETAREIESCGGTAVTIQADFCQPVSAAETIVKYTVDELGGADVLINNAAIFEAGNLAETSEELWDRHFDINLKAPYFLCRSFADQLEPGRPGHIISIADRRATRPGSGYVAYTLTKSGLVSLTRILAKELAPQIQVNAVAPGAILPPVEKDESDLARLATQIPLQRTGKTRDVCDAVRYLLGSDFITGEVLHVAGGEQL